MNERFRTMLAEGNDRFQSVKPEGDGVPAGSYVMQLQGARLDEFQTAGGMKLKILWEHLIREGDLTGEVVVDWSDPLSQHAYPLKLLKARLVKFGEDPEFNLADLEEIVARIVDSAPLYTAFVKINKTGRRNVEVREVHGTSAGVAPLPVAAQTAAPDPNQAALMALADAHGLGGIDDTWTMDEIVGALKGEEFAAATLTPKDVVLLDQYSIAHETPKPERKITKRATKKGGKRKR